MSYTMQDIKEMKDDGTIYESHTSLAKGYERRTGNGSVEGYKGRFGEGFKVHTPNFKSTRYHYTTYYLWAR